MRGADFAAKVAAFAETGSLGVEELDDFAAPLQLSLTKAGFDRADCTFAVALSFHINQLTPWDLLVLTGFDPSFHPVVLAHNRSLTGTPPAAAALAAVRKPPITHGVIPLEYTDAGSDSWKMLRTPAIRFLAAVSPPDLGDLPGEMVLRQSEGQSGAALLLLTLGEATELAQSLKSAPETIFVQNWTNLPGGPAGTRVLILLTCGGATHEI